MDSDAQAITHDHIIHRYYSHSISSTALAVHVLEGYLFFFGLFGVCVDETKGEPPALAAQPKRTREITTPQHDYNATTTIT
jgi:hypothetical protein